jgi:hypothetical protein
VLAFGAFHLEALSDFIHNSPNFWNCQRLSGREVLFVLLLLDEKGIFQSCVVLDIVDLDYP